ncbi:E3 ubiquitin-protein ligase MBR2 [Sesamum alatum]|uniref:RING-type E3 ubiquitin transferase n=1 Tax=Sesamum alatum TaxID=300844 RepID=A0AAE1YV64_9LAMI|nr:E3 ubiquitin-protein ligase MBR2 [Sesamum alatum]
MMQEIILPHQFHSTAASGGARMAPGRFRSTLAPPNYYRLLPHQIINIPTNPAWTHPHGYLQIQERNDLDPNWIQEDETLILDIGMARPRENVERDGRLSERLILKYLKTSACREIDNDGEPKICVVCQDDLMCQENSSIGMLECGHEYHASCIRQWLQHKNICPLCKAVALPVRR